VTLNGRGRRSKGRVWQSELAARWRESGLFPAAYSSQGAQTRSGRRGAALPPDVDGTPYRVEAKHTRNANPIAALRQSITEARKTGDTRAPIAVVKPNADKLCGPVVVMRLEDWEALVQRAQVMATATLEAELAALAADEIMHGHAAREEET
jgi:hypothetical protein